MRLDNSMPLIDTTDTNAVLLPNRSPLVSFRILFMTGSGFDPKGKEGVASLTAAMLAHGGSRAKTYAQITDAMYPMATSFQWQVDKEMSVFSGTTHIDNLEEYYSLIREMLIDPGFREDDFKRLKEEAINYLKNSLRGEVANIFRSNRVVERKQLVDRQRRAAQSDVAGH